MLTKLFNNFIKHQGTQVSKHWRSSTIIFKMNSTDTNTAEINLYSLVEKDKILDIINNEDAEDLLRYSITEKRAQNLELHRAKNGPYNSLEELLQVKGMNKNVLDKFYKSIITGKKRQVPRKVIPGLVVTPKVTNDDQKKVNTVLGIHTGADMISWSLLNRDCEVLEWNYKFFQRSRKNENIHSLLQTTLPIVANFPKAERYVMQEFANDNFRRSSTAHQVHLEQSVRNAIILTHLAILNSKDTAEFVTNNIFILRQSILQKLYGLVIGTECMSTQYMLQTLLRENEGPPEGNESSPTVYIKPEFQDMYNVQSAINKERISWPLLIALAFVELMVHERTDLRIRNTEKFY